MLLGIEAAKKSGEFVVERGAEFGYSVLCEFAT
jgi:hypothetical protein